MTTVWWPESEQMTESAVLACDSRSWPGVRDLERELALGEIAVAGVLRDLAKAVAVLIGLARPGLGERTERVARLAAELVAALDLEDGWEFEVAANLSQIGWLGLSEPTYRAACARAPLSEDDCRAVLSHPLVARDLLASVPRLENVREMIARQGEPVAVRGEVGRPRRGDRLALGGQVLRVCGELDALMQSGLTRQGALDRMRQDPLEFDQNLVNALSAGRAATV